MPLMPVCPPRLSMVPKRKYRLMPQAIVPRGRKWPESFSVSEPISTATTAVSSRPATRVSQGEAPAQASQPGRSVAVVSAAVV
jgi:hypothetical protein